MEELISNNKNYYALLKKDADSLLLDKNVVEQIVLRSRESLCLIDKLEDLKGYDEHIKETENMYVTDPILSNIEPFLETIKFFFQHAARVNSTGINSGEYILSFFRFELSVLFPDKLLYNKSSRNHLRKP